MLRFGETKIATEKFYAAIWDVNGDNIVISKLVKTKTNSKYLIGYSDRAIKPLVLIIPKLSGYVKTFKVEDKISKLMSFRIDDQKLLEKYKAIWTKIEDFKNILLNALPFYDNRCIKTKIRKYDDDVYKNFRGLNVPEDGTECGSFTVISIDFLLVYENKYYLQVYLDNCAYKFVSKQMTNYLDDNISEDYLL